MAEERFKTTLMGGFDKDDVLNQVREMKDAAYAEKSKLIKEKKEQEKQIQELKKQLAKKDSEKAAALQKQKEAHKEEIAFAQWLHNKMGGDIHLLNEQNQSHVKTPDYIWNSKLWDLKSLSSEKAANSALRKGINQISGNPGGAMLDCRKFNVEEKTLLGIIEKRMKWHRDIEVDIMIVKSESDIRVIRYKQI